MAEGPLDIARTNTAALGITDDAVKAELKKKVKEALEAGGTPEQAKAAVSEAIQKAIKDNEKTKPKDTAAEAALKVRSDEIATNLVAIRTAGGANGVASATKAFDEAIDKASGGFPMGIVLGGAAGVAAAVATDIGDWKSFGGIMKKLALVAAGVGVGIAVNNDYGLRDQALNTVGMGKPSTPAGNTTPPAGGAAR